MERFEIGRITGGNHGGCGLALAAVREGEVAVLSYIGDIAPDVGDRARQLPAILLDARVTAEASILAKSGEVLAVMCHGQQFTVLRAVIADEREQEVGAYGQP